MTANPRADQDAQWIRERLNLANWAAYRRLLTVSERQHAEPLTVLCPLCGEPVLNDGTFEACADCPEGE